MNWLALLWCVCACVFVFSPFLWIQSNPIQWNWIDFNILYYYRCHAWILSTMSYMFCRIYLHAFCWRMQLFCLRSAKTCCSEHFALNHHFPHTKRNVSDKFGIFHKLYLIFGDLLNVFFLVPFSSFLVLSHCNMESCVHDVHRTYHCTVAG